jgi:hypothetical protein
MELIGVIGLRLIVPLPHVNATREEGRENVFDYVEMFYNPKRRHGTTNDFAGRLREAAFREACLYLEKTGRFNHLLLLNLFVKLGSCIRPCCWWSRRNDSTVRIRVGCQGRRAHRD